MKTVYPQKLRLTATSRLQYILPKNFKLVCTVYSPKVLMKSILYVVPSDKPHLDPKTWTFASRTKK